MFILTLEKGKSMSERQEIMIDLYHPAFRQGFLDGRQAGFREKGTVINKQYVYDMYDLFEESEQEGSNEQGKSVYYPVGYFIGQLSSCAIPRHSSEEQVRELREAFLLKVRQKYGVAGESRVKTIRQYWTGQDRLAQMLGTDLFEQMITLGAYTGCLS
jgi:hypothetical protein